MPRDISVEAERFPIAGTFTISRGSKTEAEVLTCTITEGKHSGRGECVPYRRYGETMESVRQAIEAARDDIAGGAGRDALSPSCRLELHATRLTAHSGTSRRKSPAGVSRKAYAG